jgi:hypothetical protein
VFNDYDLQALENVEQLKDQNSCENLRNPAYPVGHPMNATFDPLSSSGEKVKRRDPKVDPEEVERISSPLGLSSSSSFTSNLIAQRFNLAADDPVITMFTGDDSESKGDLVKNFFASTPLYNKPKQDKLNLPKADSNKRQRKC